jgi:hypothetical protein
METVEVRECKLVNGNGETERFYRQLPSPTLIGMEACGNSEWLEHEVCIGDAAQIRASYVRKQKTDRRDAAHILKLLIEGRFPRLWTPSAELRNLRQLLIYRHKLVWIRVQVKNGLQHLMLNRGVQLKEKLWSQAGQKALRELTLSYPEPGFAEINDSVRPGVSSKFRRRTRPRAFHLQRRRPSASTTLWNFWMAIDTLNKSDRTTVRRLSGPEVKSASVGPPA